MKLLFDQNLPRQLVRQLTVEFPGSRHVTEVELDTATDGEIWSYAGEHGLVIVSKDSDFRQLAFLNGPPPKAVWRGSETRQRVRFSPCSGTIVSRCMPSANPRTRPSSSSRRTKRPDLLVGASVDHAAAQVPVHGIHCTRGLCSPSDTIETPGLSR